MDFPVAIPPVRPMTAGHKCVPGEGGEGAMDDVCSGSGCSGEALECVQ